MYVCMGGFIGRGLSFEAKSLEFESLVVQSLNFQLMLKQYVNIMLPSCLFCLNIPKQYSWTVKWKHLFFCREKENLFNKNRKQNTRGTPSKYNKKKKKYSSNTTQNTTTTLMFLLHAVLRLLFTQALKLLFASTPL